MKVHYKNGLLLGIFLLQITNEQMALSSVIDIDDKNKQRENVQTYEVKDF